MRWSGATGAIARCKRVSTGCGRKRRSARVWRWICGVKPKPKAGNKPWQHFIVHGLDKPGSSATVSVSHCFRRLRAACVPFCQVLRMDWEQENTCVHFLLDIPNCNLQYPLQVLDSSCQGGTTMTSQEAK